MTTLLAEVDIYTTDDDLPFYITKQTDKCLTRKNQVYVIHPVVCYNK